jgi:HK97 family phage major capsid protein
MTLAELQARREAILARRREIAEMSDPTVEALDEFDALETELAEVDQKIVACADSERQTRASRMRQQAAVTPALTLPTVTNGGSLNTHAGSRITVKPPEKFKTFGDQLQAIASVAMSGREDNRLTWSPLTPSAAVSGAGASIPSDGGYQIQTDTVTDLMSKVYGTGQVLSRVQRVPISTNSDSLKVNLVDESSRAAGSRWGGVQVYWGAEADSATSKKPKFRQAELSLKDVIGLMYATDRLLQDASALETIFTRAFISEIQFTVEDSIFNGTGAGQMKGILTSAGKVAVNKEGGQPAATLVYENVLKMWSRMWAPSRANSAWFINQDIEPQLHAMAVPVGTGGLPVYLPPGGLSQSPYGTLFGRPVIPTEYNPTLGTEGDIVLADLNQYLMIDKGGIQADSSVHVRFIYNERTFRFIYRCDGQPMWNSALTPAKGTNTLSPYVTLQTRA